AARVEVTTASAMLHRLASRGAVSVLPEKKRTKRYQVTERLYNVYHLMRRSAGQNTPVRLVVDFMYAFYDPDDLVKVTLAIAAEACSAEDARDDHYRTYLAILEGAGPLKRRILKETSPAFFGLPDLPAEIRKLLGEREQKKRPKVSLAKLQE